MTVRVGRVVTRGTPMEPVSDGATGSGESVRRATGRIAPKALVDACIDTKQLVDRAHQEADSILTAAKAERDRIVAQARREGLDEATAKLGAAWIAQRTRDASADRRAEERVIAVARVLAERLLGEALRLDPTTVVTLAREAMRQLRRADGIAIEAHPDDVELLRANLAALPVEPELVTITAVSSMTRGSVRILSNLGVLDAELAPQLDRLTDAIRRELLER